VDEAGDRFWEVVRPQAKLVYDMDDTRAAAHGVYYTASQPWLAVPQLSLAVSA
jgi:hypothetical protein